MVHVQVVPVANGQGDPRQHQHHDSIAQQPAHKQGARVPQPLSCYAAKGASWCSCTLPAQFPHASPFPPPPGPNTPTPPPPASLHSNGRQVHTVWEGSRQHRQRNARTVPLPTPPTTACRDHKPQPPTQFVVTTRTQYDPLQPHPRPPPRPPQHPHPTLTQGRHPGSRTRGAGSAGLQRPRL